MFEIFWFEIVPCLMNWAVPPSPFPGSHERMLMAVRDDLSESQQNHRREQKANSQMRKTQKRKNETANAIKMF